MFKKSSGKLSPIGDYSPEMLAGFPLQGNVPKLFPQVFPNRGKFHRGAGELSQCWDQISPT